MAKKLHTAVPTTPEPILTHDELLKQANEETVLYIKYMREHNDKDRLELATKLAAPNADFTSIISWNLDDMIKLEIKEGVIKYFDNLIRPRPDGESFAGSPWEAVKIIYAAVQNALLDNYGWQGEDLEPYSTSIAHNACAILRRSALKNLYRCDLKFIRYNAKKLGEVL
jgi:hypothetical protein